MNFRELLKDDIFKLPLIQKEKVTFKVFIFKKLKEFENKVNLLDDELIDSNKNIKTSFVKKTLKDNIKNLNQSILEYLNGNPHKAYEYLEKTLKGNFKDLTEIFKNKNYVLDESFFRIRTNDTNYPYSIDQMLHIPFEHRGKVSTQRYSIPGFPSLYLGKTIYICWEELRRPSIDKIQIIRLKNIKTLKILDLTPPIKDCSDIDELYKFLMTFPLIMCSSVKVKNDHDTFKPEYIIPQLLLQWIRNNSEFDGIQYKSTHITTNSFIENSELTNIVLPVKSNNNKGLCKKLINKFESTEVVSWSLYQFATGGQNFMYNSNEFDKINKRIPKLELINGVQLPYSYSTLGNLEYYLENLKTKSI